MIHAASLDVINNKIYFLNETGSMAILDMKQKEKMRWKIIKDLINVGDGAQGIMIKNEFHVIGGFYDYHIHSKSKHVIYNDKTTNLDIVYEFDKATQGIQERR